MNVSITGLFQSENHTHQLQVEEGKRNDVTLDTKYCKGTGIEAGYVTDPDVKGSSDAILHSKIGRSPAPPLVCKML